VVHDGEWRRFVYVALAVHFTIRIPFHARTYIVGDVLLLFPVWYSALLVPYLAGLTMFSLRLRFRAL
jgi:hypothetical protein